MRRAGAVAGILIVVVLVFLYRFNTLGGSRGGFPDDHFINLARANQLLDGDWPLRDYSDGSLQGMWPPLSYLASAGAQVVVGRTLLAEALLTSGAIAVAAGITMAAGAHLTGAVALGAAAALLSVIPAVKTYGYARPLLFSTVLLLLFRYIDRPMARTLLPLSASLSVAFLFRHDYALYLASGVTAALLTMPAASPMFAVRRLLLCGSISIALLVPTLIGVQALVGFDSYLQTALAVVQDETARTDLDWPVLNPDSGWTTREHRRVVLLSVPRASRGGNLGRRVASPVRPRARERVAEGPGRRRRRDGRQLLSSSGNPRGAAGRSRGAARRDRRLAVESGLVGLHTPDARSPSAHGGGGDDDGGDGGVGGHAWHSGLAAAGNRDLPVHRGSLGHVPEDGVGSGTSLLYCRRRTGRTRTSPTATWPRRRI